MFAFATEPQEGRINKAKGGVKHVTSPPPPYPTPTPQSLPSFSDDVTHCDALLMHSSLRRPSGTDTCPQQFQRELKKQSGKMSSSLFVHNATKGKSAPPPHPTLNAEHKPLFTARLRDVSRSLESLTSYSSILHPCHHILIFTQSKRTVDFKSVKRGRPSPRDGPETYDVMTAPVTLGSPPRPGTLGNCVPVKQAHGTAK